MYLMLISELTENCNSG